MTSLVMMYVFYDKNGDIKAITPFLNDYSDRECSAATMPLAEVELFLLGKRNPADYQVKKLKTITGEKFSIVKKVSKVSYLRTLDNFLTEIGPPVGGETVISIVNQRFSKTVLVEIAPDFREMYTYGSGEQKDDAEEFLKFGRLSVYITKKHDPYVLYKSLVFSTQELFDKGRLYFNYENDMENTSAYTKKIITGYGYREKL